MIKGELSLARASDSVTVDTEFIQTSPDGTTSKEVDSINLKKVYHLEEG